MGYWGLYLFGFGIAGMAFAFQKEQSLATFMLFAMLFVIGVDFFMSQLK